MTHNGIRILGAVALAVAALGTGTPAQAQAATAPDTARPAQATGAAVGETQLVTVSQSGDLNHTVRHADGTWQRMGFIPGFHQLSALTSVILAGEENVVLQYNNGSGPVLGRLVRHTDGTWNLAASTPPPPAGLPALDLAVADVNGRLDLVWFNANGPQVSELGADGHWSAWSVVPTDGKRLLSVAAAASGNTLRVVELTEDGKTVGVADRSAAGWTFSTWAWLGASHDTGTKVTAAQVGSGLQIGVMFGDPASTSPTRDVAHMILDEHGNWAAFDYLSLLTHLPAPVYRAAMTAADGELQLTYATDSGRLYHTIRHVDGTWQTPGDVLDATGGSAVGGLLTIAGI